MQDEASLPERATALSEKNTVRWRRFDRALQDIKARHADIPAQQLQLAIDEACAAVRQEMELGSAIRKETP